MHKGSNCWATYPNLYQTNLRTHLPELPVVVQLRMSLHLHPCLFERSTAFLLPTSKRRCEYVQPIRRVVRGENIWQKALYSHRRPGWFLLVSLPPFQQIIHVSFSIHNFNTCNEILLLSSKFSHLEISILSFHTSSLFFAIEVR